MINWAHLHLMVNHFPVVGMIGAFILFLYGVLRKTQEILIVGLAAFVLIALVTVPVFLTGEKAESVVKDIPGVTEDYIGRHEEAASYALVLMETLGATALFGFFLLRRSGNIPAWFVIIVLALSLLTMALMGVTANYGGQIRHMEIRAEGAAPSMPERIK